MNAKVNFKAFLRCSTIYFSDFLKIVIKIDISMRYLHTASLINQKDIYFGIYHCQNI